METKSIFEMWIENIQKVILAEDEGKLFGHNTLKGDIKEEILKHAIHKILPSIYEIGTGEIIDYKGNRSNQIDIIIARKDFPTYKGIGNSKIYLIESVLATIEIKSRLDNEKEFFNALNNCYSIIELIGNYRSNKNFINELQRNYKSPNEGMLGERKMSLIRPATYIYAYEGYKKIETFANKIIKWIKDIRPKTKLYMYHLPSLITCNNYFACRNILPYSEDDSNFMLLGGKTQNPFIIFMFHLLYQLQNKIINLPDKLGITPDIDLYINNIPEIEFKLRALKLKYDPTHELRKKDGDNAM